MENEYDLNGLSPAEYEKIMIVLTRDRKLRLLEEARILQLKRDLAYLRKRAALRPGVNADRCCARCLELLGRILNRGALCPLCLKKICKSCRRFSPPVPQWNNNNVPSNNVAPLAILRQDRRSLEHEWLCVVCHKRMQLKAVSGEWMEEYNNVWSQRKGKTPPGDQLRKVLHHNQRQSLLSSIDFKERSVSAFDLSSGQPPPKPPRTFAYEGNIALDLKDTPHIDKDGNCLKISDSAKESSPVTEVMSNTNKVKMGISTTNVSPRPGPRVSPWSGIEAEPRIPVRSLRAASFGHLMSSDCADSWMYKDKDSIDDSHFVVSLRSRSTSSDVMDEPEQPSQSSIPRKIASPLRKQQAIPEPSAVTDNQNSSSLDTTDSGIFSPGIKGEDMLPNKNRSPHSPLRPAKSECSSPITFGQIDSPELPRSPLMSTKSESDAHYSSEVSESSGIKFPPHLTKSDASSSETESPKVTKRVIFKKKKQTSRKELSRKVESKFWSKKEHNTAADHTTHISQNGLTNPITNFNASFIAKNNPLPSKTNSSSVSDYSNFKTPSLCNNGGNHGLHVPNKLSKKHAVSKSAHSFVNEAMWKGIKQKYPKDTSSDHPPGELKSNIAISSTRRNFSHRDQKLNAVVFDEDNRCHKNVAKFTIHPIDNFAEKHIDNTADVSHPIKCQVLENVHCSRTRDRLLNLITTNFCRSTSVPRYEMASSILDKPNRSLFRSHSLDGWLRYFEDIPFHAEKSSAAASKYCRAMNEVLPDDYKLVFVDCDIDWTESDAYESNSSLSDFADNRQSKQSRLRVKPTIKTANGVVYIEDSDWEIESDSFIEENEETLSLRNTASIAAFPRHQSLSIGETCSIHSAANDIKTMPNSTNKKNPKKRDRKVGHVHLLKEYLILSSHSSQVRHHRSVKACETCTLEPSTAPLTVVPASFLASPANVIDLADCFVCLFEALAYRQTAAHDLGHDTIGHQSQFSSSSIPCAPFLRLKNDTLITRRQSVDVNCGKISALTPTTSFEGTILCSFLTFPINLLFALLSCSRGQDILLTSVGESRLIALDVFPFPNASPKRVGFSSASYLSSSQLNNHFFRPPRNRFGPDSCSPVCRQNFPLKSANRDNDSSCCLFYSVGGAAPATGPRCSVLRPKKEKQRPVLRVIDLECCLTSCSPPPSHLLHFISQVVASFSVQRELPGLECSTTLVGEAATVALVASPRSTPRLYGELISYRGDAYARPLREQSLPYLPVSRPVPEVGNNNNPHGRKLAASAIDVRSFSICCSGRRGRRRLKALSYMNAHSVPSHNKNESPKDFSPLLPYCTDSILSREVTFNLPLCELLTVLDVPGFGDVLLKEFVLRNPILCNCIQLVNTFQKNRQTKKFIGEKVFEKKQLDTCNNDNLRIVSARSSTFAQNDCLIYISSAIEPQNLIIFARFPSITHSVKSLLPFPIQFATEACALHMHAHLPGNLFVDSPLRTPHILSYIKYFLASMIDNCPDVEFKLLQSSQQVMPMELDSSIKAIENRSDCCCSSPCDVPTSPSVVDATIEEENSFEDTEMFSSGDELDKFESDTDSQDTVIEGEAYKRMRSVAIKEKILHANEELFGTMQNVAQNIGSLCIDSATKRQLLTTSGFFLPKNSTIQEDEHQIKFKSNFSPNNQTNDNNVVQLDLPLHNEAEEFDETLMSLLTSSSIISAKDISDKSKLLPCPILQQDDQSELLVNSKYRFILPCSQNPLKELYSSESSDNGSDIEEVFLSDTSTSSDEACYTAPTTGMYRYNAPMSYKLHTIMEESCEESEKSSRGNTPTSRASSDFIYYSGESASIKDPKFPRSPKKIVHKFKPSLTSKKTFPENPTDSINKKDAVVNAVLASTRLENYFRSTPQEKNFSFTDDDLTDESGGISSDDDRPADVKGSKWHGKKNSQNNIHTNQRHSTSKTSAHILSESSIIDNHIKQNKHYKSHGSKRDMIYYNHTEPSKTKSSSQSPVKSNDSATIHSVLQQKTVDEIEVNYANSKKCDRSPASKFCRNLSNTENVSDDEAKYIMTHVIQHITNNNESSCQTEHEMNDISPAMKILESEIARLMLTVSPVSLSAGEPSSSCSSTIGSNNSDYGSDTLESCEETTSDDDHPEPKPHNSPQLPFSPHLDADKSPSLNQRAPVQNDNLPESNENTETVTDETLYICKQLVASLKKIADSTEANMVSNELSKAETDDNTAKQYIADQIVSLMQTVNASQNNSPLIGRSFPYHLTSVNLDSLNFQDRSDSDSPQPLDEKRGMFKNKTPSESGSETTISASISIPSYDDSDRTPTESEISHEMDELYALLESTSCSQDTHSFRFAYDSDSHGADGRNAVDSPTSDIDDSKRSNTLMHNKFSVGTESSLFGAASKLESLLPISIEERIARYNDAFLHKENDDKVADTKDTQMRINVILPQPSSPFQTVPNDKQLVCGVLEQCFAKSLSQETSAYIPVIDNSMEKPFDLCSRTFEESGVTSVQIVANNFYQHVCLDKMPYSEQKVHSLDSLATYSTDSIDPDATGSQNLECSTLSLETVRNEEETTGIVSPLPKVINPKEKASSENDLLVANYRAKSKNSKVFGTKSAGNISELENIAGKSTFRDTGYYSFKSSDESFLSLDDSTNSRTSTTSLTQYRSLTSTETIPEEEESNCKAASPSKISLSSGNIPFEVCDTSASKSSTLPLSLRGKMSSVTGGSHRTRSSFFSTSGVLRKLTLLRDESGNSLRSSPHGRLRIRHRTLSGGSEDGRQKRDSLPQISVSECSQSSPSGTLSAANSERDSLGRQEEDTDQIFTYQSRSQMSLSSFGGRSESVTSVYSAAGGGRYGTVTVTGDVFFSLKYNYKGSVFEVHVKECQNLAPVDIKRNRSDPYVKVYLLPDRTKSGKRKTKVKKHTLNPVFDELLKFHVTFSELEKRVLWLTVWHSDRFGRNDFLGEVVLELEHDSFENGEMKCYPLQERTESFDAPVSYKGDIILALKYVPPDVTSRKPNKKHGGQAKGSLHVLVREARNLMATRSNGTSDPFCKSYLLPDKSKAGKQKTSVFKKTCSPKWNHTFVYDDVTIDDLKERCLELTIWDYDKITSNDFLGGVRLCLGTGKHQGRDVDWMDSSGEEVSLWYTMTERPNTWVDRSLLLRPSMQNRRLP